MTHSRRTNLRAYACVNSIQHVDPRQEEQDLAEPWHDKAYCDEVRPTVASARTAAEPVVARTATAVRTAAVALTATAAATVVPVAAVGHIKAATMVAIAAHIAWRPRISVRFPVSSPRVPPVRKTGPGVPPSQCNVLSDPSDTSTY